MFLVKFINSIFKCYRGELWLRLTAHLGFLPAQGSGSYWDVISIGGSQWEGCFLNETAQQNRGWGSTGRHHSARIRVLLSPMSPTVKTLRSSLGSSPIWNPAFCLLKILSCCCSVTKLCPTLSCDPMDCPVLHYLLHFAQTHILWVDDATQSSYPLSPPSPPALSLS